MIYITIAYITKNREKPGTKNSSVNSQKSILNSLFQEVGPDSGYGIKSKGARPVF